MCVCVWGGGGGGVNCKTKVNDTKSNLYCGIEDPQSSNCLRETMHLSLSLSLSR